MDFDLTEDQQLLTETLNRLLADHYDFEQRLVSRAQSR